MKTIGNILLILFVVVSVYALRADLAPLANFLGTQAEKVSGELRQSVFGVEGKDVDSKEKNKLLTNATPLPTIANTTTTHTQGLPGPLATTTEPKLDFVNNTPTTPTTPEETPTATISATSIIAATNAEREKNGLSKLTFSSILSKSAQVKADDMLAHHYFEHVSPNGTTLNDLVKDAGYTFLAIGENLAYGNFTTSVGVVRAWMNSPGHRANILSPNYSEIGIGIVHGMYNGSYVWMLVQHFGSQASLCPEVDQTLKLQVQSSEVELKDLEATLAQKREVIDQTSSFAFNYDTLINEYNALIVTYNDGVAKVKEKIALYNSSVNNYNLCLKNYVH